MSEAAITLDWKEFDKAMQEYRFVSGRAIADILNQKALDIVAETVANTPPASQSDQSRKVKDYFREQLSQRVKLAKGGKRKGRFIPKGARSNQLQKVHLIANKLRGKQGKKGLYGADMKAFSGSMVGRARTGVGTLKAIWMKPFRSLMDKAKFNRRSFVRTFSGVAQWPGSIGGRARNVSKAATPQAQEAIVGTSMESIGKRLLRPSLGKGAFPVVQAAMQKAIHSVTRDMEEFIARELEKVVKRITG